jgi:hypothetical protein
MMLAKPMETCMELHCAGAFLALGLVEYLLWGYHRNMEAYESIAVNSAIFTKSERK